MRIRLAGIQDDSIVDGPGLRLTVFTQGCPHHCPGCHNPESHDPAGGKDTETEKIAQMMDENPLLDGVTLSGGEPFSQTAACAEIARMAHARGLNVWTYSGWTFEALWERAKTDADAMALLRETDVLVDGRFVLDQRSLEVPWRGSKNQRLIDAKRSLEAGEAVLLSE